MGIKVVIENNGSDVLRIPDHHPEIKRWYTIAYHLCDGIIQDSRIVQQKALTLGAPYRNNKIIELGIDTKIFNLNVQKGIFRKKYNIPNTTKIVFSPRAFTPLYNIGDIIKTIPIVSEAISDILYVFCSYTLNKQWTRLINKLKVNDNVLLLGYVDNETELPYIYVDSDIVISIPSSDSSPRTVYEAISCGCTAIVSDLPWIDGKFQDGKDLFTVPVGDVDKFSSLIIQLLTKDKFISAVDNALYIQQNLDYHIYANQLKDFYLDILLKTLRKEKI